MASRLSDICDIKVGFPFKSDSFSATGIKLVRGMNVSKYGLRWGNQTRYWPKVDSKLEDYLLREGDVLIAMDGNVATNHAYIRKGDLPLLLVQRVARLRPKGEIPSPFIWGLITSKKFHDYIESIKTGTTISHISAEQIGNFECHVPSLLIQKKIAAVLSAIDDKIELNNKLNANLEEELRSSFAHDYLASPDFKNWRKVQFGDIVSKFATGLNPRKNFVLGHGDNFYVTIKNMADNQVILDDKCDKIDDEALAKINARSDLRKGDFLFSGIGTIGRVFYIDEDPVNWNISESVFTIRPNGKVSTEFMYLLLLSNELQNYVNLYAQGSAQKGIRMSDFKKFNVALPSDEYMKQLTETWKPLINQTKILYRQNRRLSELRDALLPKLMSGEIDVSNVEVSE